LEEALRGEALTTEPAEELDARIAAAFSDDAKSGDVARLLAEVKTATSAAEAAAEAASRLGERVVELKELEADRRMWAEHERVLDERDRLAEEMERMADSIAQIAHLVRQIEACDREIGRLNAISAAKFGHIGMVLSGAAPAISALFQDALVWDSFIAVAGLQSAPVVSCGAGANDKPRVRRSASSPTAV
jgi:hypothetical protein